MIIKLGPAVVWALYLAICYAAAPEILPFIFWCIVLALVIWVAWLGVLSEGEPPASKMPPPEPHYSPLKGAECKGVPKYLEYRKFMRDGQEILEITRQCPECKMTFFEKKPKELRANG